MPAQPGVWIRNKQGVQYLQVDKVGCSLGLLKVGSKVAVVGILKRTISVFQLGVSLGAPHGTRQQFHENAESPKIGR
jgi:hypothetical protein